MTNAFAGWLTLGTGALWVGYAVRSLTASRRVAATSRERARIWQWLALGGLQVLNGLWFLVGPPTGYPAIFWWLLAGYGALLIWMVRTDIGPWLRTRSKAGRTSEPS